MEPFEKKFALALTTLLSFLTGCSTVSKLESGCSLRGDNVNPWYWPARFLAKLLGGLGRRAPLVTGDGACLAIGLIGMGPDISTFVMRPLLLLEEGSSADGLVDLDPHSWLTGQKSRRGKRVWPDGEELLELLELLGGCVKSGLPRVLQEMKKPAREKK